MQKSPARKIRGFCVLEGAKYRGNINILTFLAKITVW